MKIKTHFLLCGAILGPSLLAGCSNSAPQGAANELEFSLSGISQITISYDGEPITFLMIPVETKNGDIQVTQQ